jgi:CRISPR-associated protein Csy2
VPHQNEENSSMSQYLLLNKISVQNANAIAGLTYGFPAITNFLGFAHALSRQLPAELKVALGGVAVVSHQNTVHARQPKGWGDYVFALSRNPLTQQGNTAPINEEGRMHMQISLLIEVNGLISGDTETTAGLIANVKHNIPTLRLAGGQISHIENIEMTVLGEEDKALRKLMPGFVLIDRSDYLASYYEQEKQKQPEFCLFDAWCDFAQLKYKAQKITSNEHDETSINSTIKAEANNKAEWHYVKKPNTGYLVPITTGYCAISPIYDAGKVANVRDAKVPTVFTEAAYSVGEWQSVHRVKNIARILWHYEHKYPWYVAKSSPFVEEVLEPDLFEEMPF